MGFLCIIATFGCLFGQFFQSVEQPEMVSPREVLMARLAEALAARASPGLRHFVQQPYQGCFGSIIRYETVVSPTFKTSCQAMPSLEK
tara:strand:+ start:252 stop:515 length:264 start_codon:yes stop_codon:yes gene_type:complete